jgi:hypothetical protein
MPGFETEVAPDDPSWLVGPKGLGASGTATGATRTPGGVARRRSVQGGRVSRNYLSRPGTVRDSLLREDLERIGEEGTSTVLRPKGKPLTARLGTVRWVGRGRAPRTGRAKGNGGEANAQ